MVLVFRQFGTSRPCFVWYSRYICVPRSIRRVPVNILWTMTGPQCLLFRPIISQQISSCRLIFRDVLCNCFPSIVQRWSRFVAHWVSPAIKNSFDSCVVQWRVARADFCVPLAGASVILQRSSPGLWLGALKVSVTVHRLWCTFALFVPHEHIKWTHKGEFICQFACFGSQQSG